MSQISMPIRIVAVAAIALIAAYMMVLRPKSSTPAAPAATPATTPAGNIHTGKPAVTQFGKAVQAAQGAAKAEENQAKANAGESTTATGSATTPKSATKSGTSSTPSSTPAAPATDLAGLPRPVRRAVHRHQVLALLFWNGRSADDRAVRSALRHVQHFDGTVYTHAAPVNAIARYGRIARGVDVEQSPTVVVVDRKLHATTLVGYVDVDTIDQAVVDALRATGGIFKDHYLASVNGVCSTAARALYAVPRPETIPQARHDLRTFVSRSDRFVADFGAVAAPKKWRGLRRASLADLRVVKASNHKLLSSLRGHPTLASVQHAIAGSKTTTSPATARFNRRMEHNGLIFCGPRG